MAHGVLPQLNPLLVWTSAPAGSDLISRTSFEPRVIVAQFATSSRDATANRALCVVMVGSLHLTLITVYDSRQRGWDAFVCQPASGQIRLSVESSILLVTLNATRTGADFDFSVFRVRLKQKSIQLRKKRTHAFCRQLSEWIPGILVQGKPMSTRLDARAQQGAQLSCSCSMWANETRILLRSDLTVPPRQPSEHPHA